MVFVYPSVNYFINGKSRLDQLSFPSHSTSCAIVTLLDLSDSCTNHDTFSTCLLSSELVVRAECLAGFVSSSDGLLAFFPAKEKEASDNHDPVEVVCNDGSICRAILPSEERVENTPTAITVLKRGAALKNTSAPMSSSGDIINNLR
jgi:hypothetical protein